MAAITSDDISFFRVFKILQGPARTVFRHILKYGTNNTFTLPLTDYLENLPPTSTANYITLNRRKKYIYFSSMDRMQIMADPSCNSFDITLLYKCIMLACENIAAPGEMEWGDDNVMEGLMRKIKDVRNNVMHDGPLLREGSQAIVSELREVCCKLLELAKSRYNIPEQETIDVRNRMLEDISGIIAFNEVSIMSFEQQLPIFIEETRKALKKVYLTYQHFDPLFFLSGSPVRSVSIQSLFCKVILKGKASGDEIEYTDLFKQKQSTKQTQTASESSQLPQDGRPELVIINGIAGSGKTTLLNFVISEWLKDEHDRRIKCLEEYDFVLRILCRENVGASLKWFLEEYIPAVSTRFNDSMMVLLRRCKILFLIDGLDELDSSSGQLVSDILKFGANLPEFKIVATSRPERVVDFLVQTRQTYRQQVVDVIGIVPSDRTDCVLKHYRSLANNPTNEGKLRDLMESIGWRQLFALPLNLLFVATLFIANIDSVEKSITQSSLYFIIHQWCVEKLQERLSKNVKEMSRQTRQFSINRILKNIYEVALGGLLQDRLTLSKTDIERLVGSCVEGKLPSDDVIGSFFALRQYDRNMCTHEEYSVPSDGLQEFYAALYIMEQLRDGCVSGIIRRLLPDSLQTLNTRRLRNAFLHVAWLLSQPDTPPPPGAAHEVVDLLAETKLRGCNAWLSLLEDTEVISEVVERIAHHVRQDRSRDEVRITDTTMCNGAALLPLISSHQVQIDISHPELDMNKLSQAMSGHKCTKLFLWHHYKYPHPGVHSSDAMLRDIDRSYLQQFVGHLSAGVLTLLPKGLKRLYLVVSDNDHAHSLLPALTAASHTLPCLEYLFIHVPLMNITSEMLTQPLPPLPDVGTSHRSGVVLTLSGVQECLVETAWQVAEALHERKRGYFGIRFPGCRMGVAAWRRLLECMAAARLRTREGSVAAPYPGITAAEWIELMKLANTRLGCDFDTTLEESLWKGLWPEDVE